MAAKTSLSALLLLRSAFSSSSSSSCARCLPFCNVWKIPANHTTRSTGNPRHLCSALTELTDSADVLKYLRDESDPQKIREIFNRRANDPAFGSSFHAYKIASKKLGKAKAFDKVEEILEKLLQESYPCPEEIANKVMRLYGTALMPDHVIRTFQRLKDLGLSPSEKSFTTFLAALVDAGSPNLVHDFFNKIEEYGLSPTVYTYSAIVKAFCAMNDYDSAITVLHTMKEKGLEPTRVTYDTIFVSLYSRFRENEISGGKLDALLDKLLESSNSEVISYCLRIRRLCNMKKTDEAMALLQEAQSKGLDLSNQTLNSLVITLCKDKKLKEAKDILEMIQDPRGRSDHAWNMLVRGFLEKNDLETARKLFEEMFEYDRLPDAGSVNILLNALIKANEVETDEARLLIDKLKQRMPASAMKKWEGKI